MKILATDQAVDCVCSLSLHSRWASNFVSKRKHGQKLSLYKRVELLLPNALPRVLQNYYFSKKREPKHIINVITTKLISSRLDFCNRSERSGCRPL